jgi:hypothetical protein
MDMLQQRAGRSDPLETIMPFLDSGPTPGGLGGGSGLLPAGGGGGDVEQQARQFFLSHGYSRPDWRKVDSIIERESGWDPNALNESSGAAGIAQKISGFGPNYSQDDPLEQIRWLANYLENHVYSGYGTGIDAALAHKNATGWY